MRLLGWMALATAAAVLSFFRPEFRGIPAIIILRMCWQIHSARSKPAIDSPRRARYQIRNPNAGRWLEAPVAELDKSTVGKLLASRASRDPSIRFVVGNNIPPDRSDALYDPEIDG